eukprot:15804434-Heterocapsa_arctica.AAC.1
MFFAYLRTFRTIRLRAEAIPRVICRSCGLFTKFRLVFVALAACPSNSICATAIATPIPILNGLVCVVAAPNAQR